MTPRDTALFAVVVVTIVVYTLWVVGIVYFHQRAGKPTKSDI